MAEKKKAKKKKNVPEKKKKLWDSLNSAINFVEKGRTWRFLVRHAGLTFIMVLPMTVSLILLERSTGGTTPLQIGFFEVFLITVIFTVFISIIVIVMINISNKIVSSRAERAEERRRLEVRKLEYQISVLEDEISKIKKGKEFQELKSHIEELRVRRDFLVSEISQGWKMNISTEWGKTLIESGRRLLEEEYRLRKRNRINLLSGIFAAIIGVIILISVATIPNIFNFSEAPKVNGIPVYYFSSVPIAIISEIVAIFFLRLFASTEQSIERNKNEMTNIELRLTACQLLESKTGKDKFDSLADTLSKEERNFVLKKNESSAITDSDKLDIDRAVEIAIKAMKAGL